MANEEKTFTESEVMDIIKMLKDGTNFETQKGKVSRVAKELAGPTDDPELHDIFLKHLVDAQLEADKLNRRRSQATLRAAYVEERDKAVQQFGRGSQAVRDVINRYRKAGLDGV
jgi:hypothetical protein